MVVSCPLIIPVPNMACLCRRICSPPCWPLAHGTKRGVGSSFRIWRGFCGSHCLDRPCGLALAITAAAVPATSLAFATAEPCGDIKRIGRRCGFSFRRSRGTISIPSPSPAAAPAPYATSPAAFTSPPEPSAVGRRFSC